MSILRARVRLRKIVEADLPAIAKLLSEGFSNRSPAYWLRGLQRYAEQPQPEGCPTFGFCLENDGVPVGVILLLFSSVPSADGPVVRANVASWYIKPNFRSFGSLLITSTTRDKNVTYFNISPARHTWSTVEAQGFSVYCKGQIYGAPSLSRPARGATVEPFSGAPARISAFERHLLERHASFGCISVVVRSEDADYPFVFKRHRVKGLVPVCGLIYCRSMDDFNRYAGNLGRFLLWRCGPLVLFDANEPMPGVAGWYSEKRGRKYVKGAHPPRLGDLSFTEAALFDS